VKPKSLFESKVFWFNLALSALVGINEWIQVIAVGNVELTALATIMNFILRLYTVKPATIL